MIFIHILFLLYIIACSTKSDEFETFHFNINRNLLSQAWIDSTLLFSFSPPKSWKAADTTTLNVIRSKMNDEYSFSPKNEFRMIQLFADSLKKNFCSISSIDFRTEMSSSDSLIQFFDQQIRGEFQASEINTAKVMLDRFKGLQYRIILPDRILFKLIFINARPKIIQVDYAIARSTYYETIESVESSLGSIYELRKE